MRYIVKLAIDGTVMIQDTKFNLHFYSGREISHEMGRMLVFDGLPIALVHCIYSNQYEMPSTRAEYICSVLNSKEYPL